MTAAPDDQRPTPRAAPLVETTESVPRGMARAVMDEAASLRRGFANWAPMLGTIAVGRLRGRPPQLRMVARSGPRLQTPPGDRSWWTAVEVFGRDCYRFDEMRLPPAPVVVDVGANIGAFSLALLALRPGATVAAYEASPAAVAALRRNIAANRSEDHVSVHHCAVVGSAACDAVWLNEQEGDLCTSSVVLEEQAGPATTRRVRVPAVSLASVLASHPGGIDLLKVDVEGAEYDIVSGTPIDQLAKVRLIVLEYHDVPGHHVDDLAGRLDTAGLVWERQEHGGRPGHGLGWWRQRGHG